MSCARYNEAIQDLADGTLGAIRKAELQLHLDECDACRALASDFQKIRDTAASLDRLAAPDRVWLQVAGRLRQEGRISTASAVHAPSHRHYTVMAIAAGLMLAVGASLFVLFPEFRQNRQAAVQTAPNGQGNAAAQETVQTVETEFRLAEQHYQNAIAKLEEAAKSDTTVIDPQTAAKLQENLRVIDRAIAESRAALRTEPQSAPARDTLFEALRRKVSLLQDTIALMNAMRKGNAAGAAQLVDEANKG
jgi:hypothetical protein